MTPAGAVSAGGRLMSQRIALVTGASRGIGRATVRALALQHLQVMAVARSKSDLEAVAEETGASYLAETVATPEGCVRIIEETRRRLGRISSLVNNAGVDSADDGAIWGAGRDPLACDHGGQSPRTLRADAPRRPRHDRSLLGTGRDGQLDRR